MISFLLICLTSSHTTLSFAYYAAATVDFIYHTRFAFTITSTRRLPGLDRAGAFLSPGFILKDPF